MGKYIEFFEFEKKSFESKKRENKIFARKEREKIFAYSKKKGGGVGGKRGRKEKRKHFVQVLNESVRSRRRSSRKLRVVARTECIEVSKCTGGLYIRCAL